MQWKVCLFLGVSLTQLQLNVAKRIPGTKLETGTFYQLNFKTNPGMITWSAGVNSSYNYVIIDKDHDHRSLYEFGGKWHKDSLWEFISIPGDQPGWYGLRNQGRWSALTVYESADSANGGPHSSHIVLNRNYKTKDTPDTFLLKPVAVTWHGETFYQLKFKNIPKAVVTWADNWEDKWNYIQVDNDNAREGQYAEGGEWFETTLIDFRLPR